MGEGRGGGESPIRDVESVPYRQALPELLGEGSLEGLWFDSDLSPPREPGQHLILPTLWEVASYSLPC